jgi:thioredoxin-dependent peroxiredoxin
MPLPKIGDLAPDFVLPDAQGKPVSLKDFRGQTVVLYFYPKDDTPGCTQEACDFRDHARDFSALAAVIIGVSKDTQESHGRFLAKYKLPFTLLSDPELKALKAYGVWQKKTLMGRIGLGVVRSTFVIDPQGVITHVYSPVKVAEHVAGVLAALQGGQA